MKKRISFIVTRNAKEAILPTEVFLDMVKHTRGCALRGTFINGSNEGYLLRGTNEACAYFQELCELNAGFTLFEPSNEDDAEESAPTESQLYLKCCNVCEDCKQYHTLRCTGRKIGVV